MKIVFIASVSDNHSRKWVLHFKNLGYEVHWITLKSKFLDEIKDVKVYPLVKTGIKPLDVILNFRKVKRLVRKINPDILHCHYAGVNGALGALSKFHPFILTAYGSDILVAPKSYLNRQMIKWELKKADVITCNGNMLKNEMIKLGADESKIRFIYWGTDLKKFEPGGKNTNLLKELNIPDNSPVVISIRNLEPVYDIETILNAIPLVLKEIPQSKFIIAGTGTLENKLKKMAKDLNIESAIRFTGWLDYNKLPNYFNSSDVYISTSLTDGDLCQSTQQAMACEKPVIVSDILVNTDRINNMENGIIFPIKNNEVLAEKIIILLKDKDLRIKLGKNGRKLVQEKLDYDKNMEEADKLYKNYEK